MTGTVIAGDYAGKKISSTFGKAQIEAITAPLIIKKNIESYEIVNTRTAGQTSVKGIFGVGFSKAHVVYQISLTFNKGKNAL